jgi:hypothetical protein
MKSDQVAAPLPKSRTSSISWVRRLTSDRIEALQRHAGSRAASRSRLFFECSIWFQHGSFLQPSYGNRTEMQLA